MTRDHLRDAATIILVRDATSEPSVLMGQRGKGAAFMPSKFVFPGGAVDDTDQSFHDITMNPECAKWLSVAAERPAHAYCAAALRELWEETGQILGDPGEWTAPHEAWTPIAEAGVKPNAECLKLILRARTPKGRPRRFDARFFLADADHLATDPDDLNPPDKELSHLHWVKIKDARRLDLPFITDIALSIVEQHLRGQHHKNDVPFYQSTPETGEIGWLSHAD